MSATEGNGTLKRLLKFSLVVLLAAGVVAAAETPKDGTSSSSQDGAQVSAIISGGGISSLPENPVERVRTHQSWEYGPFVNGGWGLGNRDNFHFFSAGVEVGKVMTPVLHAGILSGQFQFAANLMPIWQAYTPAPHEQSFLYPCSTGTCYFVGPDGGGTYTGARSTPRTSFRRICWCPMGRLAAHLSSTFRRRVAAASTGLLLKNGRLTWE